MIISYIPPPNTKTADLAFYRREGAPSLAPHHVQHPSLGGSSTSGTGGGSGGLWGQQQQQQQEQQLQQLQQERRRRRALAAALDAGVAELEVCVGFCVYNVCVGK